MAYFGPDYDDLTLDPPVEGIRWPFGLGNQAAPTAIPGRHIYKPNAFQEMFTPKGMGYQWQDRVADSGEVSTGDIEDLRMVNMPPPVVTPPVVTPSTPHVPIEGGDNTTIDGSYLMTRPYPRRSVSYTHLRAH